MNISAITALPDWELLVQADDGRTGRFDVKPYLDYEVFAPLRNPLEFAQVRNGRFFIEWKCGADLSADTIEAEWRVAERVA